MGAGEYSELDLTSTSVPLVCYLTYLRLSFEISKSVQVQELIKRMQTCPDRRKAIVTDLYRLYSNGI